MTPGDFSSREATASSDTLTFLASRSDFVLPGECVSVSPAIHNLGNFRMSGYSHSLNYYHYYCREMIVANSLVK
jgi:hypothetical protein